MPSIILKQGLMFEVSIISLKLVGCLFILWTKAASVIPFHRQKLIIRLIYGSIIFILLRTLFFILTEKYGFDITSKNSQYYFPTFHQKTKSSIMTKFLFLVISVNNHRGIYLYLKSAQELDLADQTIFSRIQLFHPGLLVCLPRS